MRPALDNRLFTKGSLWLLCLWSLLFFSTCTPPDNKQVDRLNDLSYACHYRNLDSTRIYANRALALAKAYDDGQAEALNNLAFYHIAKMQYRKASNELKQVAQITDNQIELLVADIQQMRLCQRESRNKEFYDYMDDANRCLRRINEEDGMLPTRAQKRMTYARSELAIVTSTYYYYIGLEQPSVKAIHSIDPDNDLRGDTAQQLNYAYNVGAGGIVSNASATQVAQTEFDYLFNCYLLAQKSRMPYWEANALQALSEHLQDSLARAQLVRDNPLAIRYLNPYNMADSLLSGYLAQRSLDLFSAYCDSYQVAGAYRTLATCYWQIGDNESALICLNDALRKDTLVNQAPDLVASIREQLSVVYSALNDKQQSDYNRNIYLDLHQQTRQDRLLESRADQLNRSSAQLNGMIVAVVAAIVLLCVLLYVFNLLRLRSDRKNTIQALLEPLQQWKARNTEYFSQLKSRYEDINEAYSLNVIHIANNKKRSLEQRAKISLVNSVMPFIDRMLHEIDRLRRHSEAPEVRRERYGYIVELIDKIDEYNTILTQWIQMRQGELSLHIESFPLQQLFDVIGRSRMSFQLKGITLNVTPTEDVVKADRVLTLFMINTIADNARKFTPKGGTVTISSKATESYVEISVEDNGQGLSTDSLSSIFDHKVYNGHGFGLMNCKGIIEKYRKISQIFSVCQLSAESTEGQGSRFFFRLPRGVVRLLIGVVMLMGTITASATTSPRNSLLDRASQYADSAYFSNIRGTYERTLLFADTCRFYLNRFYLSQHPDGHIMMKNADDSSAVPAEVKWYHDSLPTEYGVILDIRNESAVAALALHKWQLYQYNNKVYTQLFKEVSADNTLSSYCKQMRRSEANKTIAVVILVLVLLLILPAYYFIYYRRILHYRYCLEKVKNINCILSCDTSAEHKLSEIHPLLSDRFPEKLQVVVQQILEALRSSADKDKQSKENIELAEDEKRRAEFEDERLHVSNSILDNCLSTLKHETMYYPSRIRQLVDGSDENLQSMEELANYYKELYTILSGQAMRQVESMHIENVNLSLDSVLPEAKTLDTDVQLQGDRVLLKYLFDLLRKQAGGKAMTVSLEKQPKYAVISLLATSLHFTDRECLNLFQPAIDHIPYLLCRQIARDHGEASGHRGCGISAIPSPQGVVFVVTLPRGKEGNN